mgnify:CR=1 FL=1
MCYPPPPRRPPPQRGATPHSPTRLDIRFATYTSPSFPRSPSLPFLPSILQHRTSPFPAQVRFDRAHDYAPLPFSRIPAAALTISGKGGGARSGMKNPHFEHILQAAQCEKLLAAFKAQPRRVAASPSSSTSPRASPTAAAAASRGASPQPATQQPGAASTEGNMWTRGPPRAAAEAARKRAAAPPASAAPAAKAAATRRSKPASKPAAKAAPKRAATAAAAPASTAPAKSAASSSKSAASAAGASAATAEEEPKPTSGAFSWADRLKASNIAAQAKQGAPKAAPKAGAATAATAPAAPAASKAPRTIAARTAPSQAPAPQASKTPTQASKTPTQAPKAPTQQQQQQQQRSTGKGKGKKQSAKAQPSSTLNQFVKMWETMQSAGGQPGLGNGYTKQDALAAVARIKATVTTLLSEATVIPQGSFAVDLWLPGTSNVDLVVELPASASLGNTSAAVAQVAAGAMNPGSAPFSPGAPGSPDYQRLYSSLENLRVQLHADTQTPWASQIIGGHPSPTLIMRLQPGIAPGRPTQPGPIPIGITVRVPGHTGVEVVELSNGLLAQIPLLRPLLYVLKQLIRVGVQVRRHHHSFSFLLPSQRSLILVLPSLLFCSSLLRTGRPPRGVPRRTERVQSDADDGVLLDEARGGARARARGGREGRRPREGRCRRRSHGLPCVLHGSVHDGRADDIVACDDRSRAQRASPRAEHIDGRFLSGEL